MKSRQTEKIRLTSESLSTNPVQRAWIARLLEIYYDETDDIFDNANFLATLQKVHNLVEQDTRNHFGHSNTDFYKEQAMKDWPRNNGVAGDPLENI